MAAAIREDYNKRLFSGGLRSRLHLSRFYWLRAQVRRLNLGHVRAIELGCFDGKTIEFLDPMPERYLGLDANWEGGVDAGRERWKDFPNVELRVCVKPEDIPPAEAPFDVGICMETLEHVPPELVDPYLFELSRAIDGYLFITVPIERGLVFFMKHSLKKTLRMKHESFHRREFFNCVFGRMSKVDRREHKGFDDRALVMQVKKYFDIISVTGVFPNFPILSLNLTIGIVARTRACGNSAWQQSVPPK
ncbi:MAG TPA: class I SAM-dependent methyltransferase [Blastocatellia bacterium]